MEATGHLIKGSLGGGMLGIHEAYQACGIWTSLGVLIFFGFYLAYCDYMLVHSAQVLYMRLNLPPMTYPDVAEYAIYSGPFPSIRKYRKHCRYAIDATVWTNVFGACCVYHIIIAKTIKQVVENEGLRTMSVRLYILILLVPILLLCMLNTLKLLAPFSLVANIFIAILVVSTIVYSQLEAPPLSTVPGWVDIQGFIQFCGIAVFAIEGGVLLPIENNMENPQQFLTVLCTGLFISVFCVAAIGFFGFWGYGDNCQSPITMNFPALTFPTILRCLVALMIYFTYALNFQVAFNLFWHYAKRKYKRERLWTWERVERACIIVIISLVAIAFPNIGNLMGLSGALLVSLMAFIYPAIINTLVMWEVPGMGKYKWRLWKNSIILSLGFILLCAGTFVNIKGLLEK